MNPQQVNKVLDGKITTADCMIEEQQVINMLANVVAGMKKSLNNFRDKKDEEYSKMENELGENSDADKILKKFQAKVDEIIHGRAKTVAQLEYVYDYFMLTRTWDSIKIRRSVKEFSDTVETKIFHKGVLPKEMMSMQQELFMKAWGQIELINMESKEFSEKQKTQI